MKITVAGEHLLVGEGRIEPVLGAPNWHLCAQPLKKSEATLLGWIDTRFSGMPCQLTLYNRGSVPLELAVDGKSLSIDRLSGLAWTNPQWLATQWDDQATTPMDHHWKGKLGNDPFGLTGNVDPDSTKDTGSANYSGTLVRLLMGKVYGRSEVLTRFLDQYLLETARRPRAWLKPGGVPEGMVLLKDVDRAESGAIRSPKLSSYDEWWFNAFGMNFGEPQHLNAEEPYEAWVLYRWPRALYMLLNFYYTLRQNSYYLQRLVAGQNYAAWRTLGYWLRANAMVWHALKLAYNAASSHPQREFYLSLMWDIAEEVTWHLENRRKLDYDSWPAIYGSVPENMKPYYMPWQRSVELRGLQYVLKLMSNALPEQAVEYAKATERALLSQIEDAYNPDTNQVEYVQKADGSEPPIMGSLSGTGLWGVAAMRNATCNLDDVVAGNYLAAAMQRMDSEGWANPNSKKYPEFLKLAGDTLLEHKVHLPGLVI